jgi:hypothetical protein
VRRSAHARVEAMQRAAGEMGPGGVPPRLCHSMKNIQHPTRPGPAAGVSVLSVMEGADGVWSVNEEASDAQTLSYFASKHAAVRHALRVARQRRSCEVRLLGPGGRIESTRSYEMGDVD